MSILISGIGIAGPTLAYWLSVYGIKSTLVERAPRLRAGGYAIDFWGVGFDVAERMGILPDVRRDGYNIREMRTVNAEGRRVGGFDVDIFCKAARGRYVTIARSDLARNIYRKIDGRCEAIFGDSITGINQLPDGVEVTFEHAPSRHFDLVIGADGLHSIVRKLTFGGEDQFEEFLGYSVAAFEVAGYPQRDEDIYVNYSVPGKQVGRLSLRDDRTLFLFVFADERGRLTDLHDTAAQKEALRAQFGGLGWECPQILAALDSCPDLYYDRVSQIRMQTWSKGRVGLVGDAGCCHRSSPARARRSPWLLRMCSRANSAPRPARPNKRLGAMKSVCILSSSARRSEEICRVLYAKNALWTFCAQPGNKGLRDSFPTTIAHGKQPARPHRTP